MAPVPRPILVEETDAVPELAEYWTSPGVEWNTIVEGEWKDETEHINIKEGRVTSWPCGG